MKIAFVGKGGSGKSTLSWLYIKYLERIGKRVLAIDADYNVDLAQNLGVKLDSLKHLNESEADFYNYLGLKSGDYFSDIVNKFNESKFSYPNMDSFTKKYSHKVSDMIDLIVVGSYHDDMLYSGRCSHAYMAPLKFYLPYLDLLDDSYVVSDSVAGIDMVTYGLYVGSDLIVCVVEPTRNSINVYYDIKSLAKKYNIPVYVVLNKYISNEIINKFILENKEFVLGQIGQDVNLLSYDFNTLQKETLDSIANIYHNISKIKVPINQGIKRIKEFKDDAKLYNDSKN